jgi:hypothetical protein
MTDATTPWDQGRRAWRRLARRLQDGAPGDEALRALADIRDLGQLLREAELTAVRISRRHGGTWAEIATRLGITRQSAWERWRDLDDAPAGPGSGSPGSLPAEPVGSGSAALGGAAPGSAAADMAAAGEGIEAALDAAALEKVRGGWGPGWRPGQLIEVPDVVGLSWDDARQVLYNVELIAVGPDPDGPPLAALGWPGGVVVRQQPPAGARLPARSSVTVWVERGGGSAGVREPRRPGPSHGSAAQHQDEPFTGLQGEGADEAVG